MSAARAGREQCCGRRNAPALMLSTRLQARQRLAEAGGDAWCWLHANPTRAARLKLRSAMQSSPPGLRACFFWTAPRPVGLDGLLFTTQTVTSNRTDDL